MQWNAKYIKFGGKYYNFCSINLFNLMKPITGGWGEVYIFEKAYDEQSIVMWIRWSVFWYWNTSKISIQDIRPFLCDLDWNVR